MRIDEITSRHGGDENSTTKNDRLVISAISSLSAMAPRALSEVGAGIVKPVGPLSAKQVQRRSVRQQKVQKSIRDEQTRSSAKLNDLRAKL
jgi:hypothetical protein